MCATTSSRTTTGAGASNGRGQQPHLLPGQRGTPPSARRTPALRRKQHVHQQHPSPRGPRRRHRRRARPRRRLRRRSAVVAARGECSAAATGEAQGACSSFAFVGNIVVVQAAAAEGSKKSDATAFPRKEAPREGRSRSRSRGNSRSRYPTTSWNEASSHGGDSPPTPRRVFG